MYGPSPSGHQNHPLQPLNGRRNVGDRYQPGLPGLLLSYQFLAYW